MATGEIDILDKDFHVKVFGVFRKVMIDFDLAELYGASTRQLNQQVTRNQKRFPEDLMFRLTREEAESDR